MAVPASALGSGRQRHLLSEAQAAAAFLREIPQDAPATQVYAKLHELAKLVRRLRVSAELPDPGQQTIWRQRGGWLHDELTALAAERLQSDDPSAFWSAVVGLLYAGAEATDLEAIEKDAIQAELDRERLRSSKLQEQLNSTAANATAAATAAAAVSVPEEELQAQNTQFPANSREEAARQGARLQASEIELQRAAAEAVETQRQLQALSSERDDWRRQYESLRSQGVRNSGATERQSQVIAQLMERSEEAAQQTRELADESEQLQVHNKTLSVNLEQHATVLEKLIGLNTELMDNLNAKSTYLLHMPPPLPLQTPAGVSLLVGGGDADNLDRANHSVGRPLPLSFNPAPSSFPGLLSSRDAHRNAATPTVKPLSIPGFSSGYESSSSIRDEGRGSDGQSLGQAFQSFLTEVPPAGALELAEPLTPPSLRLPAPGNSSNPENGFATSEAYQGSSARGGEMKASGNRERPKLGLFGFLGYIAGSDKAREARAAEFGSLTNHSQPPNSIQRQLDAIV